MGFPIIRLPRFSNWRLGIPLMSGVDCGALAKFQSDLSEEGVSAGSGAGSICETLHEGAKQRSHETGRNALI